MAQLEASIDKNVDLNAELGGDPLEASLDKRVDLVASMDFRTDLLAEFGVGFKTAVWIMSAGVWNDNGLWLDAGTWNDGV
jgi:hypothetical protein